MTQNTKIAAGEVVLFTNGEYSDYAITAYDSETWLAEA
jgi:hypothetical protein